MTFKTLFSMAALTLGLAASSAQAQWLPNLGLGILQPPASNCSTGNCPPAVNRYQPVSYAPAYNNGYARPVSYAPVSYQNNTGVYGNCPGGVCPPVNCVNGQCFPANNGYYSNNGYYGNSSNFGQPVYTPVNYSRPYQYQAPVNNYNYSTPSNYYSNDRYRTYPSANNSYRNNNSPFYP